MLSFERTATGTVDPSSSALTISARGRAVAHEREHHAVVVRALDEVGSGVTRERRPYNSLKPPTSRFNSCPVGPTRLRLAPLGYAEAGPRPFPKRYRLDGEVGWVPAKLSETQSSETKPDSSNEVTHVPPHVSFGHALRLLPQERLHLTHVRRSHE